MLGLPVAAKLREALRLMNATDCIQVKAALRLSERCRRWPLRQSPQLIPLTVYANRGYPLGDV